MNEYSILQHLRLSKKIYIKMNRNTQIIKFAIIAATALAVMACTQKKQSICVMTYNVGVFEKSGSNSMEQIAGVIRESGAEYISLNELDSCNQRHGCFQLRELAQATGGWNYHFAKAFDFAGGGYGNGIMSPATIISSWSVALPKAGGAEPRSMAVVETEDCVFASVHLDHIGEEARCRQAEAINKWFTDRYPDCSKPVILCGDMNAAPDSGPIRIFKEKWILLSGETATIPSDAPACCIDYIFALKTAAGIKSAEIIDLQEDFPEVLSQASDHRPVAVRIEF